MLIRPIPLQKFENLQSLDEAQARELINIATLHQALDQIFKDVMEINVLRCPLVQKVHNTQTNVLPLNNNVGDYVMTCSHTRRNRNY